jgi:methylated-DNA-protein-cysteine methyltransferase related protein
MGGRIPANAPRIWQAVQSIPRGRVATYGGVALLAGLPRGARQVGRALGFAPRRMKLPWHRVLAAGGRIALPTGSGARREQVARLQAEGVVVQRGRVDFRRYGWQPDLDALLWGPGTWDEGVPR